MKSNLSVLMPVPKHEVPARSASELWVTGVSAVVALLASLATLIGILTFRNGHHTSVVSLNGQAVTLQGAGLYAHESVSMAEQAVGQDIVTLVVAVPLLALAVYLALKGSLRGRILRAGVLAYFAYTYLIYVFGAAYNTLFLAYVALFSASVFGLGLSILAIDVRRLPAQFSPRFARRAVASLVVLQGGFLLLMWLGRILPSIINGGAPVGLDSYTTLSVQAADLSLLVPLAFVAGVALFQRQPVGYLLGAVLVVWGTAFGLALIGMMIAMSLSGTAVALAEVVGFGTLALLFFVSTVHVFLSLRP